MLFRVEQNCNNHLKNKKLNKSKTCKNILFMIKIDLKHFKTYNIYYNNNY